MPKIDQVSVNGTTYEIVPEIAPLFSESTAYTVGDCVINDAVLYKFTAAHAAGAWTGTDVEEVTVGKELTGLKADLKQDVAEKIANANANIFDSISWYTIDANAINGYFITANGEIIQNDRYAYSDFISTDKGDKFIFLLNSSSKVGEWLQLCFYDYTTRNFIRRDQLINSSHIENRASATWVNNTTTGKYLFRLTWMSYDTSLTILKIPNDAGWKAQTEKNIFTLDKNNPEQTLIDITQTGKCIDSYHSLGYTINMTPFELTTINCEVIECTEGDLFTITGCSTNSTSIWAFVDSENKLISRSSNNSFVHGLVIQAPINAAKLIINVSNTEYYCIYKGSGSDYINTGSRITVKNYDQHYINTNVGALEQVDMTPTYFSTYCCAVVDCTGGESFTISGRGGGAGRLWAFLDKDNKLLSKSAPNQNAVSEKLIAPNDAKKLIINSVKGFASCYKGDSGNIPNDVLLNSIPVPMIHELPKNVISQPSVIFSKYVQEQSGVSGAKPTIYKNGNYFCITYGENINNSGTDIPMFAGNGVLVMHYKYFKLENGVETNVQYGTFAKMGDSYTDYNDNTATMSGGAGLPSGTDNMQYFTTPYLKDDADESYTFSGIQKYGMTPCCCSVTVNESGVTFGAINELKLYVNGEWGKFDLHRVDSNFYNELTYLTTSPPYHDDNGYKWLQPVTNGIAYFTSTDGVAWLYRFIVKTPYQPRFEVVCTFKNNMLYYAARSNTRLQHVTDRLYVGKISTDGYIALEYMLPFVETRPCLAKTGNDILLFYTPANKQITECVRICEYGDAELFFWKWFTIYKNASWYVTCYKNTVENKTIEKMYIAGGNGEQGSTTGMTFIEISFDTSKPYTPVDIPAMII